MNGVNDWIARVEAGRQAHPSVLMNRPQGRREDPVTWGASTHYGDNALGRNGMGARKQAAAEEAEEPSRWAGAWRGLKGGLRGGALAGGLAGAGSGLVHSIAEGDAGSAPAYALFGGLGSGIVGGLAGMGYGAILGAGYPDPAAEKDLPWYRSPAVAGAVLGTGIGTARGVKGLLDKKHDWGAAAEGAALSGAIAAGAGLGVSKANERYLAQQAEKSAFVGAVARKLVSSLGGRALGTAGAQGAAAVGEGLATKAAPSLLRKATAPVLSAASLGSSMATMRPTAATFAPVKY